MQALAALGAAGLGAAVAFVASPARRSPKRPAAYDLRNDTELMPNSRFREIDYIETNELWQECEKDLLDSGTAPANVGSITLLTTLFKSAWKGHFSDVRVREHKKRRSRKRSD